MEFKSSIPKGIEMTSEQIREMMLLSLKTHAKGHIDKHISNVEIYLANPVGIGEHPMF